MKSNKFPEVFSDENKTNFFRTVCNLAIPVALQSMLQASFSIVDQIMIGQLGSVSVAGSLILSVIIIFTSPYYVNIYQVEDSVKLLTQQILLAYAVVAPFKVLNMIVGGGIIRSGGKTDYVMYIDMIGTWCFGVPLGLLGAFVLKLPIPLVYFMLSLEECVRLGISIVVFRRKKWMQSLEP